MSLPCLDTSSSDTLTTGAASARFTSTMGSNEVWAFVCVQDAWIKQGGDAVDASAADGSVFVPAKTMVFVHSSGGAKLAVIQNTAAGLASFCRVQRY